MYGELWGIMEFYGELWGFMSGFLLMLVSFLFLLCSFPPTCQIQIFMLSMMSCTFVCHMYKPPREYLSQGHVARVMKKHDIIPHKTP